MKTYEVEENRTFSIDDAGERKALSNFSATIDEETHLIDGDTRTTLLSISGTIATAGGPKKQTPVIVTTEEFTAMSWVMRNWGSSAIIYPGQGIKDDLRAQIQLHSKPKSKTVYRHIGWTEIGGKPAYLHAGGAISAAGNNPKITVDLPPELQKYDLTPSQQSAQKAIAATLELVRLTPPELGWTLFAATFAPLYSSVDFGIHLSGRTGTYKSELLSLWQSHFGPEMTARKLPASWSSTPNALEAQCYYAKDAPIVIDDFVPTGSTYQQRTYQAAAEKIIRAQGNQAGRARLTDSSQLQRTMYPRGILLSTGEDVPTGHSIRARLMIMEISPGDIQTPALTTAQAKRQSYSTTTAHRIKHLAAKPSKLDAIVNDIRDKNITVGHSRTPAMIGRLIATSWDMLEWMEEVGGVTRATMLQYQKAAAAAILSQGGKQTLFLEESDPCDQFCSTIKHVLGAGLGHLRTVNGGIPIKASEIGWTEERQEGQMPLFRSRGPCIGWIDRDADTVYLDITIGLAVIKKVGGADMGSTRQTLFKRLKEGGLLARTDDSRQRNTIRITAEGHPRQVLAMSYSATFNQQELPNE